RPPCGEGEARGRSSLLGRGVSTPPADAAPDRPERPGPPEGRPDRSSTAPVRRERGAPIALARRYRVSRGIVTGSLARPPEGDGGRCRLTTGAWASLCGVATASGSRRNRASISCLGGKRSTIRLGEYSRRLRGSGRHRRPG